MAFVYKHYQLKTKPCNFDVKCPSNLNRYDKQKNLPPILEIDGLSYFGCEGFTNCDETQILQL